MKKNALILSDEVAESRRAAEVLPALLAENSEAVLLRVVDDPTLRTDAVASYLLRYCDTFSDTLMPPVAAAIADAALIACEETGPDWLVCSALREKAYSLLRLGDLDGATVAIHRFVERAKDLGDFVFHGAQQSALWGALRYYQRRTSAAAMLMDLAIRGYEAAGDHVRAEVARTFKAAIDFRENKWEEMLVRLQVEERTAEFHHDDQDLARIRGNMASCYLWLRRPELAEEALTSAQATAHDYGLDLLSLTLRREEALLIMQRDGIAPGMDAMDVARRACHEHGMYRDAAVCLLNEIEMISLLDPAADTSALCRQLQAEAASLSLDTLLAEATQRLMIAAEEHHITSEAIEAVRRLFPCVVQMTGTELSN